MKAVEFLCLLMIFFAVPAFGNGLVLSPPDSIGIERWNNRLFIKYQVEPGESLTSIAQKYKITVDEIRLNNPGLTDLIKKNQVLRIPYHVVGRFTVPMEKRSYMVAPGDNLYRIAEKHGMSVARLRELNGMSENDNLLKVAQSLTVEVPVLDKATAAGAATLPPLPPKKLKAEYHVIQENETLSSVSRKYNVPVDSLQRWNELKSRDIIKKGQMLVVGFQPETADGLATRPDHPDSLVHGATAVPVADSASVEKPERQLPMYQKANGMAALIRSETEAVETSKKLALHHSIPVGTLVKVTNPNNNQETVVRIIGKLSSVDADKKFVIKLSKAAWEAIGAVNDALPVVLEYNL